MTQSAYTPAPPAAAPTISVREFAAGDSERIVQLFREVILLKFADPADPVHRPWREYVQKRVETDMGDIPGVYIAPGGNFWVAVASDPTGAQQGETIVGMAGLERKAAGEGEVRSVFVCAKHHRLGIGRALMTRVDDWASANGYERLELTTPGNNAQARAFYESLGFCYQTHTPPLSIFDGLLELAEYTKSL